MRGAKEGASSWSWGNLPVPPGPLHWSASRTGGLSPPLRIARVIPPHEELVAELAELIAIPSLSADPAHADDLRLAADWVAARVRAAGGSVEIQERNGRPLVIGDVRASTGEDAPSVLVYAHLGG